MARLFGLLHYHFAKVLVDEFGKRREKDLVAKAVKDFFQEKEEAFPSCTGLRCFESVLQTAIDK